MINFKVDHEKCTRCSLCISDCPVMIIEKDENRFPFIKPEKEKRCIKCQHCLAICPDAAISILGKIPEDSVSTSDMPSAKQVETLIRTRRTVRQFKKEDIEPELLDNILKVTANCPSGENKRDLLFTVIDKRKDMEMFISAAYDLIEARIQNKTLPEEFGIYGLFLKRFKAGHDIIFRNAPHLMLVSSPKENATPTADSYIAMSYFELYAATNGIGTVWLGFLAHMFEFMPEIKKLLNLPEDHETPYAMLFGKPKIKYPRGVQRNDYKIKRLSF